MHMYYVYIYVYTYIYIYICIYVLLRPLRSHRLEALALEVRKSIVLPE